MVVFDAENTVLKSLTFPQVTPWLAVQLKRDPNLWNRDWVISQLSTRSQDTLAVAALTDAALHADYDLIRARALSALGENGLAKFATVEKAATDTSARVRQAAAGALWRLGGSQAVDLLRRLFEHDPSYNVRAGALVALVRADSTHRRQWITQGLNTPSYMNAIENAALDAIAVTADYTFIPTLETRMGTIQRVTNTLGILATGKDQRALDVLTRHLNDERRFVRGWVLNVFSTRIPPEVALTRLQSATASLRYDDTRQRVATLLDTLKRKHVGGQ
jgi:HEAT repeat protein